MSRAQSVKEDKPKWAGGINRAWAILFARGVLGFIFFMAGVYKVFHMGPLGHARRLFVEPYADTFLPAWSLWAMGTVIPIVELLAGALVLIGLRVRDALVALGLVLVVVTFGHLLKQPLYEFHTHVIPRLALLLFIMMLPREDDIFSIDYLLRRRAAGNS
ncbi:MAG TPA: MauE/DoxX family redox-associated membrane protein [Blastocatellia bacterium]|nr:MauE/DoxX family redox-associated membrane protein [Blastocatellia bacterium]